jgi:hypothetical protein
MEFPGGTLLKIIVKKGETSITRHLAGYRHFFVGGADVATVDSAGTMALAKCHSVELAAGRKLPWSGGPQPVPDNVEVTLWFRGRAHTRKAAAGCFTWQHCALVDGDVEAPFAALAIDDIIAWQITGVLL